MPDVTDFSRDCDNVCHSLVPSSVCMEEEAMKYMCACLDAHVLNVTLYVCVCVCLGRKPGRASGDENVRVRQK